MHVFCLVEFSHGSGIFSKYLHPMKINREMEENVRKYGHKILYIKTTDPRKIQIIELYKTHPECKRLDIYYNDNDTKCIQLGITVYDLQKEAETFSNENISVKVIPRTHWECCGNSVCGCGCDELHDGEAGYCNPYPIDEDFHLFPID